jgi:hypothetical protein
MRDFEEECSSLPGPWPWYVLLATGYCMSGLLPWLLVLWAAFRRGNRRVAFYGLALNLTVYALLSLFMVEARTPWWWLSTLILGIDLIWAMSAWLFQRKIIGPAPARYIWSERSAWISPLLIGLIIGICLSIVTGIPDALTRRQEIRAAADILYRDSVLWVLLQNAYKGVPFGLLLGFWWAGERRRFSTSHVLTFLSAFCAAFLFFFAFGFLLVFVVTKGAVDASSFSQSPEWALMPPWIAGWPKVLLQMEEQHFASLLVIPLLFGAAPRLRDFSKRLLWLPALLLFSLPFLYGDNEWWKIFQSQIIYDMSSPKEKTRAAGYEKADEMLVRYPDHLKWPSIAEAVARYRYQCGQFNAARALYQTIVRRFEGSNRWRREVKAAEAALGSVGFGDSARVVRLEIPMVDYENYLTHNWMALLSVIRYWEGPDVPESKVKMKLKPLSKSDDKIQFNPLVTMADLDDAVRSLNYQLTILPSNLTQARALISAGIPVVLVDKELFRVIYGFDAGRSASLYYGFNTLSPLTRQEGRKEAEEIVTLKVESHGESKDRFDRIRIEAENEYSGDFWEERNLGYRAPFMAVIYPESKAWEVADASGRSHEALISETRGYLAAFIGLAFLQHADPVQAFEWAKISSGLISSPLLSLSVWASFPTSIGSRGRRK